jgi:2-methylcitrate dehydratase PrpD
MSRGPSLALANFAANTRFTDLPGQLLQKLKELSLDTLGCALGAVATPEAERGCAAIAHLEETGGNVTLWGMQRKASVAGAALVNGILSHTLELDDTHAEGAIHPGCVVLPAALAVGERLGVSGKALLSAVAIGYEVAIRVALAVDSVSHRMRGWHATGTCGALGAAAAAGSLLRLDAEHMSWALGLAGVQHTGTWIFTDDGSMCKRFHPGFAAQGGITSAYLAQSGFTGPARVLEAEDGGFFSTTSDAGNGKRVIDGLGETYESVATSPKPFSACRHTHSPLFGVLSLVVKHQLESRDVRAVRVKTNSSAFKSVARIAEPATITEAQFSLPFAIGLAIRDRKIVHDQFTIERLRDAEVLEIARKVHISVDPQIDRCYPKHSQAHVEIETATGVVAEFVLDHPGEAENPLPPTFIREKFRNLAKQALGEDRLTKVEEMMLNIEQVSDVRHLADLLQNRPRDNFGLLGSSRRVINQLDVTG